MIRVAINGYGRIGRVAHRVVLQRYTSEIEIVGINVGSSTDLKGWAYLLKYDTVYGPLHHTKITTNEGTNERFKDFLSIGNLVIDGKEIPVFSQKDPSLLPWKDLGVDVVIESTGHLRTKEKLQGHITAGAKHVVLSAPAKDSSAPSGQVVPTYVISVNAHDYNGEGIVNNASCTTNCIAPVAKIINEAFGIEMAMMTTVHGYTSDQNLQDGGHKDYRRARAAAQNIIPTSTGATIAASQVVPELKEKFAGLALRVPVIVGSLSDFTFLLKKATTKDAINDAFRKAAESTAYKGILAVTEDPLVSSDVVGNPHSSVVDLSLTQVVDGTMAKVIAWYDNEFGYANRLVESVLLVGRQQ